METALTEIAEVHYDRTEAIVDIKILEGVEMTLENTRQHYHVIKNMTHNEPYAALIDASNNYTIGPETLHYTSLAETIGGRVATAHYNVSHSNAFTLNAFRYNYRPPVHIELFDNKEEALEWLKQKVKAKIKTA